MNFLRKLFQNKEKEIILKRESLKTVFTEAYIDTKMPIFSCMQGKIGNCAMVSAIACLSTNEETCKKVIDRYLANDILFENENNSTVRFNLFKYGKKHQVLVDDKLLFFDDRLELNKLYLSKSYDNNFAGPLLEKALIQLYFEGYKDAEGVDEVLMLSSLTNNLYERILFDCNSTFKIHEIITHGAQSKSLMLVTFKKENLIPVYEVVSEHSYSLIDMQKHFVKLYDPHGKLVVLPKGYFFQNLDFLDISYNKNNIFDMNVSTVVDFTDKWSLGESGIYLKFELVVEENLTEILLNLTSHHRINILLNVEFDYKVGDTMNINEGIVSDNFGLSTNSSLRLKLKEGTYSFLFQIFKVYNSKVKNFSYILDKLSSEHDEMVIRFASSKVCTITNTEE